jgi:amino acid permease
MLIRERWSPKVIVVIVFAFISMIGITASSAEASPSGLVAWWKAENNANDSVGGYNGTLYGGTTFTSGKVGQAFSFDGVDDYIEIRN